MDQPVEDWLNHVVPALMLFRAYCKKRDCLTKFTLDCQSSSGYDLATNLVTPLTRLLCRRSPGTSPTMSRLVRRISGTGSMGSTSRTE